ncbi:DUF1289 domain-containing protein [Achromobacter anxifer]|uniref:DUF1289 domain-containing protein n=1 Tax=Achromobacter anxifer TaxID=1287737 RepID=UPI0015924046|nr:DUF1289 domain-containing protein [Achromobacter anxifer]
MITFIKPSGGDLVFSAIIIFGGVVCLATGIREVRRAQRADDHVRLLPLICFGLALIPIVNFLIGVGILISRAWRRRRERIDAKTEVSAYEAAADRRFEYLKAKAPTNNATIVSPCLGICRLGDDLVCLGCHRTLDEIDTWSSLTNDQKRDVWRLVLERATPTP